MSADIAGVAARHARLRWLGVGLFGLAACVLVMNIGAVVTGHGPGRLVPLGLLALGLSLGTFGANDDTTLHALGELARSGPVPLAFAAEWERERTARPARLATLHASPKASFILPLVATAALLYAAWRGLNAWGLLS